MAGRCLLSNIFVNYTIRRGCFNGTKVSFSINNVLNSHAITGVRYVSANSPVAPKITANGTTYTDPFHATTGLNGQDTISVPSARTLALTVTFGTSSNR